MNTSDHIHAALAAIERFMFKVRQDYREDGQPFADYCKIPGYAQPYADARAALGEALKTGRTLPDDPDVRHALAAILAALETLEDTDDPILMAAAALAVEPAPLGEAARTLDALAMLRANVEPTGQASMTHAQAAALLWQLRGYSVSEGTCRKAISTRLKSPEHRDGKRYLRASVVALAAELERKAADRAR